MSERQKNIPKDRLKDRVTDRKTDRKKEIKTFQLSCLNKSCPECQQDVRKIKGQADRQKDRWTDKQKDR